MFFEISRKQTKNAKLKFKNSKGFFLSFLYYFSTILISYSLWDLNFNKKKIFLKKYNANVDKNFLASFLSKVGNTDRKKTRNGSYSGTEILTIYRRELSTHNMISHIYFHLILSRYLPI